MVGVEKLTDIYFTLNTGAKIPALGLGTANSPEYYAAVEEAVYVAVKSGYRHIDTAFRYETETYIGKALKRLFDEKVVKREDLFITTKVWPSHFDAVDISVEKSLSDLGVDYVDLVLQHWPVAVKSDSERKTLKDADGVPVLYPGANFVTFYKNIEAYYEKNGDKVKAIGVSNYSIEQLEELLKVAKVVPAVNQYECHPELSQRDLYEFNEKHGILVTAYSPLGSNGAPLLSNTRMLHLHESKYSNFTLNELAYSYHVRDHRVVIPRSINPKRIAENIHLVPLTEEDIVELEKSETKRYISSPFKNVLGW